jgi:hypothetical protein
MGSNGAGGVSRGFDVAARRSLPAVTTAEFGEWNEPHRTRQMRFAALSTSYGVCLEIVEKMIDAECRRNRKGAVRQQ